MGSPRTFAIVVSAVLLTAIAGCSELGAGYRDGVDDPRPEVEQVVPEGPVGEGAQEIAAPDVPAVWSCFYDITYNDDWHDDVLCTNGAETQRPYLREWDDFVTEAELMESARELEAELNGGS